MGRGIDTSAAVWMNCILKLLELGYIIYNFHMLSCVTVITVKPAMEFSKADEMSLRRQRTDVLTYMHIYCFLYMA